MKGVRMKFSIMLIGMNVMLVGVSLADSKQLCVDVLEGLG